MKRQSQRALWVFIGIFAVLCLADKEKCPEIKILEFGDSESLSILRGCPGADGPRGQPGMHGPPGNKGDPGSPGFPGKCGQKGEQGRAGQQGRPGARGLPGFPGIPGIPGAPGLKGDRGVSCPKELSGAKSCKQLKDSGFYLTGWYTIYPGGKRPLVVLCDMDTDGGGWIVFQRRMDGSENFDRDWSTYQNGFGSQLGEFWLGNENVYRLTSSGSYQLRFDLEDFEGNRTYAMYSNFRVEAESDQYVLRYGSYVGGTAGDSLATQRDQAFSTKDRNNDKSAKDEQSCAQYFRGGWWFESCHLSNLNGEYLKGGHQTKGKGAIWFHFRGNFYSLKSSEIKFRPQD
ncbi:ficolin-1-B-like [Pseudophryne corroboree]|uniref:ficolin-1-B-like n=1 Tax=Pseudophryne corroboree TaxID=495146 RepID=UPI003081E1F7